MSGHPQRYPAFQRLVIRKPQTNGLNPRQNRLPHPIQSESTHLPETQVVKDSETPSVLTRVCGL